MKWISVYSQLPEKYDDYLILDSLGVVSIAHYNDRGFHSKNAEPKYWMSLPEKEVLGVELLGKSEQLNSFDEACQKLCGVLHQTYSGFLEEDNGIYRTQYNYDADAVWFLKEHGYVTVSDGEWPKTKYLSFSFTEKWKRL